jgi:hypothetical protein
MLGKSSEKLLLGSPCPKQAASYDVGKKRQYQLEIEWPGVDEIHNNSSLLQLSSSFFDLQRRKNIRS